jgi:hypothetical protein
LFAGNGDRCTYTSFIGDTEYVLTLTGEIWRIDRVSRQPAEHL